MSILSAATTLAKGAAKSAMSAIRTAPAVATGAAASYLATNGEDSIDVMSTNNGRVRVVTRNKNAIEQLDKYGAPQGETEDGRRVYTLTKEEYGRLQPFFREIIENPNAYNAGMAPSRVLQKAASTVQPEVPQ